MKVLNTGGSGLIGSNLVKYYLDNDQNILIVDLKKPSFKIDDNI